MNQGNNTKATRFGVLAFLLLLGVYFALLALVSGWASTWQQFSEFWYFIVPLGAGFGLQVTLFLRLRELVRERGSSRTVVAASGTTSTAAMVSCCAHYLVNVAPVLGATGLVTFATQYQVEFFWLGIAFNLAGIAFIGMRLWKATKEHLQCVHA
jgi:Cu+-exporting ATPase